MKQFPPDGLRYGSWRDWELQELATGAAWGWFGISALFALAMAWEIWK